MSSPATPVVPEPKFRGLFIGIDSYQSLDIDNLASAVRDAQALHALFSDNVGGTAKVLVDADATLPRVRDELVQLAKDSSVDDVVVVMFSGHGTTTHELVTFDSDLYNLANTTLPLSELTDLVSAIPAKHLLVVLDCCFSGGAGAKVLNAPARTRGGAAGVPLSTEAFLKQMAGTGRVILTASTADQEALEIGRLGHGLLTYHLIQALLGPGTVAENGQINLLDLLKYVTQQVKSGASAIASARQEPTLRGQWDGEVIWPVFVRGQLYNALFPPPPTSPVTGIIRSLAGYGLPDSILDAWAGALPGLNQLQQDAINTAGLFGGRNALVMAPTSSGKTMIGELAALRATQTGGRSAFLLPTKALVNEQFERFNRVYGPAGIRVIRATGDHNDDVPALLRGQFDIAIFTYEKFGALALARPHLLRMLAVVVVDEVQTIVDKSRGRDLELLLTLVKSRKDEGIEPQIVALSAVLGDLHGLDGWLEANLLRSDVRPVQLDEGIVDATDRYRFIDAQGDEQVEQLVLPMYGEPRAKTFLPPLVGKLVAAGQQVIIIRATRGAARGAARYLSQSLGLPPANATLSDLPTGDPSQSSQELRQCLAGGVAFHVSDLSADERRIVEEHFRLPNSPIRVIVATTTLAQGINMPAETVIMPELSRRTGPRTVEGYAVAEYKNIAGRAGRLGLTDHGRAITIAYDQASANTIWNRYINGKPEEIRSRLLQPDLDLLTVALRVSAIAMSRADDQTAEVQDLVGILSNSLAAHQARLSGSADLFEPGRVAGAIAELQRVGFLEAASSTRTRLTPLGELVAASAMSVESAVRVVDSLRPVGQGGLNRATIIAAAQLTLEVDATTLNVNVKGVQKELGTFLAALGRQGAAPATVGALQQFGPERAAVARRAKKAIACLLWINGVPAAQIEQTVMQHYFDRNAIGQIRGVVSRTHDVIDTILAIAAHIHPDADLDPISRLLPIQLELGVSAGLAELAIAGAELEREHYLGLVAAGLTTLERVSAADDETLLPLIGAGQARLDGIREAIRVYTEASNAPSLDDLLGNAGD